MSDEVPDNTGGEQDATDQSELDLLNSGNEEEDTSTDTDTSTSDDTETETEEEADGTEGTDSSTEEDTTSTEETLEDPDEEEKLAKITRPSWRMITEKYPEIAKDKEFRNLYYRDREFGELFSSVEEARNISTKAEDYDRLDQNLVNGDVTTILKSMNKEVVGKLADKFLVSLGEVDKEAFKRATRPWLIDVLNNVWDHANEQNNDILKKSIRNVCKVLTGNFDIPSRVTSISENPEVKAEIDKLKKERAAGFQRDERKFLGSVDFITAKRLNAEILNGIDPKKEMSNFTRNAIADRTMKEVLKRLNSDEGLENTLRRIHKLAARSGFVDQFKSRMVSAALDRAKKLIPAIRNKYRLEAIGKQPTEGRNGKIVADNNTSEVKPRTVSAKGVSSVRDIDTRRTSELDFLNDKVTLRKN